MLQTRVIPCLLLKGAGLVKTKKFKNPKYVGDPINAVKIFNDKEVDELIFLDISATPENKSPNFKLISEIASEAFMPFGYGGGITKIEEIVKLFNIGVEKVILNTVAYSNPQLITEASKIFGNQSIVVSMDIKTNLLNKKIVHINCGTRKIKINPIDYVKEIEQFGAGEIIVNSIDNDGTMAGYDIELIRGIAEAVNIPIVASGGAGKLQDFSEAIKLGKADAVAAGSMFVFNGVHRAVLISYPKYEKLKKLLEK